MSPGLSVLTHWGRVMHICVSNLTIVGSNNGLSPGRRQAIIWTNSGMLLNGNLRTNFNESSIGIQTFSLKKKHFKMSPAKQCSFCLGLNVLKDSSSSSELMDVIKNYILSVSFQCAEFPASFCGSTCVLDFLWEAWFLHFLSDFFLSVLLSGIYWNTNLSLWDILYHEPSETH